jgi:hypothetical protein
MLADMLQSSSAMLHTPLRPGKRAREWLRPGARAAAPVRLPDLGGRLRVGGLKNGWLKVGKLEVGKLEVGRVSVGRLCVED